jgi:pSer/pThr/pTyr-binding forkhead associated (FHA) protein
MVLKLIVVKGNPEGKVLTVTGPVFRVGRNETCHLRPNSELVSREHAEFAFREEGVLVRDLGSRNGTQVNGKTLSEPHLLKDRDLVQIGPLTFAVSLEGVPVAAAQPVAASVGAAALDEVGHDEIDSWLIGEGTPSKVIDDTTTVSYRTDTTIAIGPIGVVKGAAPSVGDTVDASTSDTVSAEYDQLAEAEATEAEPEEEAAEDAPSDEMPADMIDESNPFYAKKPETEKQAFKDSSDAASDILRKMMERRKASKS